MRKTRLTLILLVLLLVTGCQYFPTRNGQDARTYTAVERARPETGQISRLLSYYGDLDGLDEDRLKTRLAQLRNGWMGDGCSTVRLKSAMILSQLPAQESDSDANTVLDPCLGDAFIRSSAEGKLALLLQDLIETRKVASGAQAEIKDYHRQIKALQDENQKLNKQLEGLKAIEKSIQQRNRH
jgi:hypothetical protein